MFFFQAEDGIRDLVRSRGLGDVYKRQRQGGGSQQHSQSRCVSHDGSTTRPWGQIRVQCPPCLLYTSDAADERSSVDLGGRRIIKKKNK